tara:strand:- start:3567 stop:3926 length:360 start_codon:yes stop_codon:yes gene_type:complete
MLYSKTHEWFDEDSKKVGITDYAQKSLGDLTYIEILVEDGDEISIGDEIAEIDSVKTSEVVYSPVSGTVCEINDSLEDDPSIVNSSAEEEGWLISFSEFDKHEELMTNSDYEDYKKEDH